MLPAKFLLEQLQVIWYSVINSITHQWWRGKCYCLLPKYLYLTCTWLKKYFMSSKYHEYLNLYLQIWKSTCTWLKYFEKYLTPTLDCGTGGQWMGPLTCRILSQGTKEWINLYGHSTLLQIKKYVRNFGHSTCQMPGLNWQIQNNALCQKLKFSVIQKNKIFNISQLIVGDNWYEGQNFLLNLPNMGDRMGRLQVDTTITSSIVSLDKTKTVKTQSWFTGLGKYIHTCTHYIFTSENNVTFARCAITSWMLKFFLLCQSFPSR